MKKKKDGTQISLSNLQLVVLYNKHVGEVNRNNQLQLYYQIHYCNAFLISLSEICSCYVLIILSFPVTPQMYFK